MTSKPHQYKVHEEFNGLEGYVWEYLNQIGRTIPQIEGSIGRTYAGDPQQGSSKDKPIWHNKSDLDEFVASSLKLCLDKYGKDKSKNPLYKAIANEISNLRKANVLIDWQKIKKSDTGVGVWRLDKTKMEKFAHERVSEEFRDGNYHSRGSKHMIYVRQKQSAFRSTLLGEYNKCVFCKHNLHDYLVGAHIVPYSIMRKEEPNNSMNPRNGLLLCTLCDIAFEKGHIKVEKDMGIKISQYLKDQRTRPIKSWRKRICTEIKLGDNPNYRPKSRFIKWKLKLVKEIS